MSRSGHPFPADWSLGDLLRHLGDIPPDRVRLHPAPGRATVRHVTAFDAHEDRLYELIDGVLVEKAGGITHSYVATELGFRLGEFAHESDIGAVTGAGGPFRFGPR